MRISIFTTDTKHHRYLIQYIDNKFPNEICSIIFENRPQIERQYETGPFFDIEKDEYEEKFFEEIPYEYSKNLKTKIYMVPNINSKYVSTLIKSTEPDIGVCFGTGLIKPYIFNIPKWGTMNIHRGSISKYRGLDSHLWALYNKDFNELGITVHYIDDTLDTGDILGIKYMILKNIKYIYSMRHESTVISTKIVIDLLDKFKQSNSKLKGKVQQNLGKYYTAISLENKYTAFKNFLNYKHE